jgi:hypothetical protein
VWIFDPPRRWRPASTGLALPGFSCGVGVGLADLNGDGDLDLAVADHCHGLFAFLGDGAGGWRMLPRPPLPTGGQEDLAFGDLDADGRLDLVAVGSAHGGLSVLLGDGRGGFAPSDTDLPEGYGTDVALGDIDRDGDLDIAAAFVAADPGIELRETQRPPNVVWLAEGGGRYRPASDGLPAERNFRGLALGDVNGDGLLDLALSASRWPERPSLLVHLNHAGRRWRPAASGHPEAEPSAVFEGVAFADLDRDANLDLVAVTQRDAGIRVWRGDGRGGWSACPDAGLPGGRTELRGWGISIADVDGDRRPDVAAGFGRNTSGGLEVWLQR